MGTTAHAQTDVMTQTKVSEAYRTSSYLPPPQFHPRVGSTSDGIASSTLACERSVRGLASPI